MLPLLKLETRHGKIKLKDVRTAIADEFGLTDQERSALLPSGKQPIIYNRIAWASTYLRKACLMRLPQRGMVERWLRKQLIRLIALLRKSLRRRTRNLSHKFLAIPSSA